MQHAMFQPPFQPPTQLLPRPNVDVHNPHQFQQPGIVYQPNNPTVQWQPTKEAPVVTLKSNIHVGDIKVVDTIYLNKKISEGNVFVKVTKVQEDNLIEVEFNDSRHIVNEKNLLSIESEFINEINKNIGIASKDGRLKISSMSQPSEFKEKNTDRMLKLAPFLGFGITIVLLGMLSYGYLYGFATIGAAETMQQLEHEVETSNGSVKVKDIIPLPETPWYEFSDKPNEPANEDYVFWRSSLRIFLSGDELESDSFFTYAAKHAFEFFQKHWTRAIMLYVTNQLLESLMTVNVSDIEMSKFKQQWEHKDNDDNDYYQNLSDFKKLKYFVTEPANFTNLQADTGVVLMTIDEVVDLIKHSKDKALSKNKFSHIVTEVLVFVIVFIIYLAVKYLAGRPTTYDVLTIKNSVLKFIENVK